MFLKSRPLVYFTNILGGVFEPISSQQKYYIPKLEAHNSWAKHFSRKKDGGKMFFKLRPLVSFANILHFSLCAYFFSTKNYKPKL